jgi:hypothetical protein
MAKPESTGVQATATPEDKAVSSQLFLICVPHGTAEEDENTPSVAAEKLVKSRNILYSSQNSSILHQCNLSSNKRGPHLPIQPSIYV